MTKSAPPDPKKEVRLEKEIIVHAPVEAVWKALTDPTALSNWFPLSARVTPGVGGRMFISWGPEAEGESEILVWEENKRLATKSSFAAVEWTLESRGGETRLRLVQSGFLTGADWENEWYESTRYGWEFILLSLQWLLEKHPQETRSVAWPRSRTTLTRSEIYERLLGKGRLFREGLGHLGDGASFSLTTLDDERWTGTVHMVRPERGFCLSINELGGALLWATIEGAQGGLEAQLWLSSFSLSPAAVASFETAWRARLDAALA
jgi:uncharacterized protein YndB with AHSA1/START domain